MRNHRAGLDGEGGSPVDGAVGGASGSFAASKNTEGAGATDEPQTVAAVVDDPDCQLGARRGDERPPGVGPVGRERQRELALDPRVTHGEKAYARTEQRGAGQGISGPARRRPAGS